MVHHMTNDMSCRPGATSRAANPPTFRSPKTPGTLTSTTAVVSRVSTTMRFLMAAFRPSKLPGMTLATGATLPRRTPFLGCRRSNGDVVRGFRGTMSLRSAHSPRRPHCTQPRPVAARRHRRSRSTGSTGQTRNTGQT